MQWWSHLLKICNCISIVSICRGKCMSPAQSKSLVNKYYQRWVCLRVGEYVGGGVYVWIHICVLSPGGLRCHLWITKHNMYLFVAAVGRLVGQLLHVTFDLHIPVSSWLSGRGLDANTGQADHERRPNCYHISVYAWSGTSAIAGIYEYDKCPDAGQSEPVFGCTASFRHWILCMASRFWCESTDWVSTESQNELFPLQNLLNLIGIKRKLRMLWAGVIVGTLQRCPTRRLLMWPLTPLAFPWSIRAQWSCYRNSWVRWCVKSEVLI